MSSPSNTTVPAVGRTSPQIALEQRRLAGAVGAEEGDDLARAPRRSRRRRGSGPGRRPRRCRGTTAARRGPALVVGCRCRHRASTGASTERRAARHVALAPDSSVRVVAERALRRPTSFSACLAPSDRLSATRLGTRIPRRLATRHEDAVAQVEHQLADAAGEREQHDEQHAAGEQQPDLPERGEGARGTGTAARR